MLAADATLRAAVTARGIPADDQVSQGGVDFGGD